MSDTFDESSFYDQEGVESDDLPDYGDFDEGVAAVEEDTTVPDITPVEDGQGEAENVPAPEEGAAPEREYVDISELDGKYVKIKVDGEETDVPVTELPQGYQRQADYTRKTQEVAEQREQLAFWGQVDQAMKVNPSETLNYLASQYGTQVASQAVDRAETVADDWGFEAEQPQQVVDPRVDQLGEQLSPVVEFVQQQMAARELENVVRDLSTKYGEEFDPTEVIREADNRQVYDPHQLESVFRDMAFEKYRAAAAATTTHTSQQQAAETARRQAAAAQGHVVGNAPSASGSVQAVTPEPVFNTPAEAALAALRELRDA